MFCIKHTNKKPNSWCTFVRQNSCHWDQYDQWKTLSLHMKCTHLYFLYKWVPLYSNNGKIFLKSNTGIILYLCHLQSVDKNWKRHYAMSQQNVVVFNCSIIRSQKIYFGLHLEREEKRQRLEKCIQRSLHI